MTIQNWRQIIKSFALALNNADQQTTIATENLKRFYMLCRCCWSVFRRQYNRATWEYCCARVSLSWRLKHVQIWRGLIRLCQWWRQHLRPDFPVVFQAGTISFVQARWCWKNTWQWPEWIHCLLQLSIIAERSFRICKSSRCERH